MKKTLNDEWVTLLGVIGVHFSPRVDPNDKCTLNLIEHETEGSKAVPYSTVWTRCPKCKRKSAEYRSCDDCLTAISLLDAYDVECGFCGSKDKWPLFYEIVRDV